MNQILGGYSSFLERANSITGSFDIVGELRAQYARLNLEKESILSSQDCRQVNEQLNKEFSSKMRILQEQISKFIQ